MTTEELWVHCQKCEREWFVAHLPLPIETMALIMGGIKCACGSKKIGINRRPKPTDEGDPMAWLMNDDTGVSSKTIWSVMMNRKPGAMFWADHPHDPYDFGRCYRLLKVMPSWRGRLPEVAEKYPDWAGLVREWDSLSEQYERVVADKSGWHLPTAKAMYARMQKLIEESEAVTRGVR